MRRLEHEISAVCRKSRRCLPFPSSPGRRQWSRMLALSCVALSGCAMLESSTPTATQPTALSWLTNWVSQPAEMSPGFDVESIRPDAPPRDRHSDNLLEITVWDLYEPGKPYSFPVRVSADNTIDVPFLGQVLIEGRTIGEVEAALIESFQQGEFLLKPRVLVRSLDSPVMKVQVTGAVSRAGFVELTRADPSAYAAIVSAGGLKKSAGTQVAVTRRAAVASASHAPPDDTRADRPFDEWPVESNGNAAIEGPRTPAQRANSVDELSVPAAPPSIQSPATNQALFSVADTTADGELLLRTASPSRRIDPEPSTIWYDVTVVSHRDQLKLLQLADGDTVSVKAATPPLRIGGFVRRPGAYAVPAGKSLNVWQAIELAGGIRDERTPLNITLSHQSADGRRAPPAYLHVPTYDQRPAEAPFVESGDVLHVEPTTGSKIKRAVGDFWNKP